MPTPRRYPTNALRQAAYRQRAAAATEALLSAKAMPAVCALPAIPSRRRWNTMAANARALLQAARNEMDDYAQQRSEAWQESERAEDFAERIQALDDAIECLDAYLP